MKRVIKRILENPSSGKLSVKETMCEIYEYGGYQFGIFWKDDTIYAIELQTGLSIANVSRLGRRTPKQDLLKEIAYRVDNSDLKRALFIHQQKLEQRKEEMRTMIKEFQYIIDNVYKFPLNDKI